MKSLVELAHLKQLPTIQQMDQETILWIESNQPKTFVSKRNFKKYAKLGITLLKDIKTIKKDWFLEPLLFNSGVHGVRHLLRSAVYSQIIIENSSLTKKQALQVITATLIHDMRRLHDKRDEGHEKRAVEWFTENSGELALMLNTEWSREEISEICSLVSNDKNATKNNIEKLKQVKNSSDALDRYRAARLDWRPNDNYIKAKLPDNIHHFAFKLVVESEKIALNSTDDKESICLALENMSSTL